MKEWKAVRPEESNGWWEVCNDNPNDNPNDRITVYGGGTTGTLAKKVAKGLNIVEADLEKENNSK